MNKSLRTDQLQFLRFCAFLLIFLFHMVDFQFSWMPGGNGAACAVSFFIILSGAITGIKSYGKEIKLSIKSIVRYMWGKIKKVYPLFFVANICAVMYSDIPGKIAEHSFLQLKELVMYLVRNLLLIQSWFPSNYFSYFGSGWFLSTIMFLNLISIPITHVFSRVEKKKNPKIMFSLIFVVTVIIDFIYCYLTRNTNIEFTQYILPLSRIGEYVCGISIGYLARIQNNKIKDDIKTTVVYTIFEAVSIMLCISMMYVPYVSWTYRIIHWLLQNSLLIYVFSIGKGLLSKLFRLSFLRYLGDLSFECFVAQSIITELYIRCSYSHNFCILDKTFSLVFCLLLILLVSSLISKVTIKTKKDKYIV